MTTEPAPLENLLADDGIFERAESHAVFSTLRKTDPVHWNPGFETMKGWWDVTRYEDVMYVSRHPELFSSERGIIMYEPRDESLLDNPATGFGKMLIMMDPPRHVKVRRLINKAFTPRAVSVWEPHIREIATDLLDGIAKKGESDFVIDVASQLPLAIICSMMGVEKQHWPLMFNLTNKVLGQGDPEYQTEVDPELRGTDQGAMITGSMGTMAMFAYFAQILQARRAERKDDLISILVDAEVDGEQLTDEDILWFSFLLILAGNETTRNGISGGLLSLCEHPNEKAKLLADMSLLPSAIEEILRWTSPVTHMARSALSDTELGGKKIAKGDRLVMWYPSANRDESVFPAADTFDITRSPNEHLAFGIGEHFCMGSGFARLELRVLYEELFRRFPDIELAGPPERLRSNFIGGIKHLPVRFTPEA